MGPALWRMQGEPPSPAARACVPHGVPGGPDSYSTGVMLRLVWLLPPAPLNVGNLGVGLLQGLGSPASPCGLWVPWAGCIFFFQRT